MIKGSEYITSRWREISLLAFSFEKYFKSCNKNIDRMDVGRYNPHVIKNITT